MYMKKLLTVALTLLLVGCASVPPAEDVSYPVQTEENVQNKQQNEESVQKDVQVSEPESDSIDAPIVEDDVEENTQDSAENDDLGEPNQVEEDSRERAESAESKTVDAPIVEEYELSGEIVDDEICKLRENSGPRNNYPRQLASSFPVMTPYSVPPTGRVDVALVFLEWDNLKGTEADFEYYMQQTDMFEKFYWMASEGKMDIEIHYEKKWHSVGPDYMDSYIGVGEGGGNWRVTDALQKKLNVFVEATDPEVDYSGIEVVIYAVPRAKSVIAEGAHDFGHHMATAVYSDEGTIWNWMAVGNRFWETKGIDSWVFYAHEFGHMVGIPDLRNSNVDMSNYQMYVANPLGGLDIMDNQDGATNSIIGWIRWVQGWLNDSQVVCIDKNDISKELYKVTNINKIAAETELLVIKVSNTKAVVVESRRWDSRFDVPVVNSRDGIIVYTVDATLGHSEGPMRLVSPRDITNYLNEPYTMDWRAMDVFLYEGDSVVVEGVKIEVLSAESGYDIVEVTKSN